MSSVNHRPKVICQPKHVTVTSKLIHSTAKVVLILLIRFVMLTASTISAGSQRLAMHSYHALIEILFPQINHDPCAVTPVRMCMYVDGHR